MTCPPRHPCRCGHCRALHTTEGDCTDGLGGAAPCECFGFECAADLDPDEDCCCDECQRVDYCLAIVPTEAQIAAIDSESERFAKRAGAEELA